MGRLGKRKEKKKKQHRGIVKQKCRKEIGTKKDLLEGKKVGDVPSWKLFNHN